MAEQATIIAEAETPEAFLADRQRFWEGFMGLVAGAVVAVVILLVLMAFFLV